MLSVFSALVNLSAKLWSCSRPVNFCLADFTLPTVSVKRLMSATRRSVSSARRAASEAKPPSSGFAAAICCNSATASVAFFIRDVISLSRIAPLQRHVASIIPSCFTADCVASRLRTKEGGGVAAGFRSFAFGLAALARGFTASLFGAGRDLVFTRHFGARPDTEEVLLASSPSPSADPRQGSSSSPAVLVTASPPAKLQNANDNGMFPASIINYQPSTASSICFLSSLTISLPVSTLGASTERRASAQNHHDMTTCYITTLLS